MKEIKVTPYDCVEDMVTEALKKASEQIEYDEIGFVGKSDLIQDVLRVVLQNADCTIDLLDMDTSDYDDMYQLTIDEDGFVTIVPIVRGNGDYIIFPDGYLYVSDEMPVTYIRDLNGKGIQYKVFGFDYEGYDDDDLTKAAWSFDRIGECDKMSDEEAQDLIDSGNWTLIYSSYNRMPNPFQQLVDFMLDWRF